MENNLAHQEQSNPTPVPLDISPMVPYDMGYMPPAVPYYPPPQGMGGPMETVKKWTPLLMIGVSFYLGWKSREWFDVGKKVAKNKVIGLLGGE